MRAMMNSDEPAGEEPSNTRSRAIEGASGASDPPRPVMGGADVERPLARRRSRVIAVAHPNIALAKYWGKRDQGHNLPAVPSLSVTLAGMRTRTELRLLEGSDDDRLVLDGQPLQGRPNERAAALLDLVWAEEGRRPRVEIRSENDFPTAAGLASSASAFAALAVAANEMFGAGRTTSDLSCLARRISASAGRSLFGGFVELPAGPSEGDEASEGLAAVAIAGAEHWDLRLIVAITAEGKKDVGSTEGMIRTARSSPLYDGWLRAAPSLFDRVRRAVLQRDLTALGPAVEQSALAMHATALASDPGLIYWNGATVDVMRAIRRLRQDTGLPAYFTIDAGPHVKVLTTAEHVTLIEPQIAAVGGVLRTLVAQPGQGARLLDERSQRTARDT